MGGKANIYFVTGQVISLALALIALLLLPGAQVWSTLLSLAAVWGITAWCYSRTSSPNQVGWWTLLAAFTLLSVGTIANVYMLTTAQGATTQSPILLNYDMSEFWSEAHYWYDDGSFVYWRRTRWGYGLLIALTWFLTGGVSIVPPLILNMTATLLSIILAGVLSRRILGGKVNWPSDRLQSVAMIATACVTYYLFSGTLLLREAIICLTVMVMGVGMLDLDRREWVSGSLIFIGGASLLVIVRSSWLPLALLGLLCVAGTNWRTLTALGAIAVIVGGEWAAIDHLFRDGGTMQYYDSKAVLSPYAFLYDTTSHQSFNALFGEFYYDHPWYVKIALMPIAACVQYLTPFPWAFTREILSSPTLAMVKFTFPWYAIGGLVLYFIFGKLRTAPAILVRITAWGVAYWLITVYVSAGSVARYGVPLLPLVVPAAIYVLATSWRSRPLQRWCWVYSSLLVIALIGAYTIQHINFT